MRLDARQRRTAAAFAVLGNGLPILAALLTGWAHAHVVFFVGGAVGAIVPLVVTLVPREANRAVFWLSAYAGLPALTAMQAYNGGPASGFSVLLMMAMIWFGLQATDREILVGIGALVVCCFGPMLVFGSPAYPVSWGHATILVLIGSAVTGSLRTLSRETRTLTDALRAQATRDELTQLLNRRGWNETAPSALATAHDAELVLIDLDGFKEVNDSMGHEEGDRVLADTAERLREGLGPDALIARLGGDEFAALFCDGDPTERLARLRSVCVASPAHAGFSAGFAPWDRHETLSELMRRADIALYAAKVGGGAMVEHAPRRCEHPA